MRRSYLRLLEGVLLSLPLLFASCGNGDNALEEIINGGGGGGSSKVAVTSLTLNETTLKLILGDDDFTLTADANSDATDKTVSWSSNDTGVATVVDGVVHAVAPGTAKITVTANDGSGVSNECNVTVPDYVVGLKGVTSTNLGWIIASDSYAYKTKDDVPTTTLKVAVITYAGTDAGDATYNHGLALALKDTNAGNKATWCEQIISTCLTYQFGTADDAKGDMAGIDNTDNLIVDAGTHTHYAASAARDFKYDDSVEAGAHPYYTSKWFLPSAGQWEKMIVACKNVLGTNDNFTDLRDCFSTRGGTNMQKNSYWSSTEFGTTSSWRYNFYEVLPGLDYYTKHNNSYYVRSALAF